jgi:hypothetical protein
MQGWDGPESRTATSTATAFVSGVSGGVRPWTDDGVELGGRYTEHLRRPKLTLGVKWSQVQILSARPENQQFRGGFGEIRNLFLRSEGAVRRPVRRPNSRLPSRRFTSDSFGYPITVEG